MEDPYSNKNSLPYKFRKKRSVYIQNIIDKIIKEKRICKILDIGGTEIYWDIFGSYIKERNIAVDIVNLEPAPSPKGSQFSVLVGDATDLRDIDDNAYDFVHSNSVIEHVGGWHAMKRMAANIKRLAPRYYVQTPNFWFPYEPHFRFPAYHWLPEQIRCRLLLYKTLGFRGKQDSVDGAMEQVQSVQLLDKRQFSFLFDDAEIIREKFLFFTKSLIAVRN